MPTAISMSNRITLSVINNIPVVELSGRLQGDFIDETEKHLGKELSNASNVIFDLKELEFITSLGLRFFLKLRNQITGRNGEVVIANPTTGIQKILDITGLVKLFPVFDSLDSAANYLRDKSENK